MVNALLERFGQLADTATEKVIIRRNAPFAMGGCSPAQEAACQLTCAEYGFCMRECNSGAPGVYTCYCKNC